MMAVETGAAITWWAVVSAFGGIVLGSVLGGTISYYLQKKSLAATKGLHDADRVEVRKALAYALLFKMIKLVSGLEQLGRAVRSSLNEAKSRGFRGASWQVVMPVVPLPSDIKFSPEEMALVLSINSRLFNEMAALDELHNSTVAIFDLYGSKRNAVLEHFGAEMQGNIGTTMVTEEQKKWLAPRAVELDCLVEAMLQRTEQDGKEAWTALKHLHAVLEKEFNLKHKLERKMSAAN